MVVRANKGFPWLSWWSSHCRNVSRAPVSIRADLSFTRGPGESLPVSGRHQKIAVFWTMHAVPGVSLPGISRHQKDATFWTAHVFPGTLYLQSAERVSSSTWLSAGKWQFPMASMANRSPKKTSVGLTATGGAVHTEVQTRVAKVWDATSLDS